MMNFPSRAIVEQLRVEFPSGCSVELDQMNDPYREMPSGLKGKVNHVDDTGTIHVSWENGSSLGVVYGVDRLHRVYANTRIEYMYRDASNYKTFMYMIVKGVITDEQIKEIRSSCMDGSCEFIPEQIGWPLIRDWEITEDDHCVCEIDKFVETDDEPTDDLTVEDVIRKFNECKDNWDMETYAPVYEACEEGE